VASIGVEPFHPEYHNPQFGYWDGKTDPTEWIQSQTPDGCDLAVIADHPTYVDQDARLLPDLQSLVTHVVCLYRRDILAAYVSSELAAACSDWSTETGRPSASGTIGVNRDSFERWAAWIADSLKTTHERWGQWPIRTIAYEDLVADWRGTMDRLGRFLGIDTANATAGTERHELRPLSEVVTNYQEARTWAAELAIQ